MSEAPVVDTIPPVVEIKPIHEGFAVVEEHRKLARIVEIDNIVVHPNATNLELAVIGGWQLCVKIGEFTKGQRAIYCEIDSMLPLDEPMFGFLEERRSSNRCVDGKNYHRLSTIKLRKELSQGLLLPLPDKFKDQPIDTNLTIALGILKYESKPPMVPGTKETQGTGWYLRLIRRILGNIGGTLLPWPVQLSKSDQDRIQNKSVAFAVAKEEKEVFEVSYKLDGSSMTVFCLDDGGVRTGVCSRNYELGIGGGEWSTTDQIRYWVGTFLARNRKFGKLRNWFRKDETARFGYTFSGVIIPEWQSKTAGGDNNFTRAVTKFGIIDKLRAYQEKTGQYITVQGELIGPDIQSNFEGVEEHEYHVFSVFRNGSEELLPDEAREVVEALGLKYVPLVSEAWTIPKDWEVKDIVKMADGQRAFNQAKGTYREGLVFKSVHRVFSFKSVSTKYLEKNPDA